MGECVKACHVHTFVFSLRRAVMGHPPRSLVSWVWVTWAMGWSDDSWARATRSSSGTEGGPQSSLGLKSAMCKPLFGLLARHMSSPYLPPPFCVIFSVEKSAALQKEFPDHVSVAPTPRAVVERTGVTFSMLSTPEAARAVFYGDNGAALLYSHPLFVQRRRRRRAESRGSGDGQGCWRG